MRTNILMPSLSAGMTEGRIARWLKRAGESVVVGEVLAEIETDKAVVEFQAELAGVIESIVANDGETVEVNATIAVLTVEGDPAIPVKSPAAQRNPESPTTSNTLVREAISPAPAAGATPVARSIAASPLARNVAKRTGVAIEELTGSGPNGRIVRVDVERAHAAATRSATELDSYREVPHSSVRKVIAARLSQAKASIPHFYMSVECEVDSLLALRKAHNDKDGAASKVSLNDFIIRATALAIKRVPEVNASWTDRAVRFFTAIDISVAVATDNGLITPIVRHADRKPVPEIATEVRSLADRARSNKLQPTEYQGGNFTISNLGMFGIHSFAAIINPPQSGILAIGAARRQAVVRGDVCVPATLIAVTLSADHRCVDGAVAARYLGAFKELIEQPQQLMT